MEVKGMEALLHLAPVFINCFPSLASGDIYFRKLAHNDVEIWSNVPVEVFPRNWSPKRKPPQLLFWSCWLLMKFSTTWTSLDFYTVFDTSFREVIHDVHYNLPWITFTLYINGMRLGSFTPMKGFCLLDWNMFFEIGVWRSFCLDYIMLFLLES